MIPALQRGVSCRGRWGGDGLCQEGIMRGGNLQMSVSTFLTTRSAVETVRCAATPILLWHTVEILSDALCLFSGALLDRAGRAHFLRASTSMCFAMMTRKRRLFYSILSRLSFHLHFVSSREYMLAKVNQIAVSSTAQIIGNDISL